jgi:hypothetical protein
MATARSYSFIQPSPIIINKKGKKETPIETIIDATIPTLSNVVITIAEDITVESNECVEQVKPCEITQEDIDKLDSTALPKLYFNALFTINEEKAISNSQCNLNFSIKTRETLLDIFNYLDSLDVIDLTSTKIISYINFLVNCQLITAERAKQILNKTIPS